MGFGLPGYGYMGIGEDVLGRALGSNAMRRMGNAGAFALGHKKAILGLGIAGGVGLGAAAHRSSASRGLSGRSSGGYGY